MNREAPPSMIGHLLSDLREESTTLLRQEVALAKAELTEKASQVGKRTMDIATGGAVAYAGFIVLLFGVAHLVTIGLIALGLEPATAVWLGLLGVGLLVAAIGMSMLAKAKKAMNAENLVPHETLQSLKDDKRWVQSKFRHSNEPAT